MIRRVASAFILIGLMILGFIWESLAWIPVGIAALIAVFCTFEITELSRKRGLRVYRRVAAWGVLALMLEATMTGMAYSHIVFGVAVCLAWIVRMPGEVEGAWGDISATCFAMAYVGLPMAALMKLFLGGADAQAWLLLTLAVVWASDTMALLVGKRFGTVKFWPKLSPGKTWEGCLGALMWGILATLVARLLFPAPFLGVGNLELVLFGLSFSIIAIFGDLAESLLKRDVGVKDSGSELTGHGGFLDLMDALLFCALPLLAYLHLFQPGVFQAP
jgi:phosphatidate cytidylyltransferase